MSAENVITVSIAKAIIEKFEAGEISADQAVEEIAREVAS